MGDKDTFIKIIEDLHSIFGNDSTEVAKWLSTPNMALNNKSPINLISNGRVDMVKSLLEEIESGFFL
jgi:uncharacterized protein (DUF2384 family)